MYSETQKTRIVNNILAATKDIKKLNKQAYEFLNLSSGFIAHYNLYGFIDYYSENSLTDDILANQMSNQWRNFHYGDKGFEDKMQKRDMYNEICETLK